ncbi:hypothetical protein [Amycolatopsis thermoflava]|uniref:hypothetical protein n=1 Tax=Amycolatopsis thermoflava TaxID=84480 RepID=UPI00364812E5
MRAAIEATTAAGILTPDVGGTAKTGDVVAAVIDNLGQVNPDPRRPARTGHAHPAATCRTPGSACSTVDTWHWRATST